MTQGRRSRHETPHRFGSYVPSCMDTCEGSQARHGSLAASQTHMLVTASYFLASAIIVIVAYFCLNRARLLFVLASRKHSHGAGHLGS